MKYYLRPSTDFGGLFILNSMPRKLTKIEFVQRLYEVWEGSIPYEVVGEYSGTDNKILISNKYGVCNVRANHLLNGVIPSIEVAIDKQQYWINQAKEVHLNYYDYLDIVYINSSTKIDITCKIHGKFSQTPNSHLNGRGCQRCFKEIKSSENPNGWTYTNWKEAGEKSKRFDSYKVYVLKCWDENEEFYKIGRTYNTVEQRFSNNHIMPYNYEVLKEFSDEDARYICYKESTLKNCNKSNKYIPSKKFRGMQECFSKLDYSCFE